MKKIRPCLWLDNNIEEAAEFYKSVFKNTKVLRKSYYTKDSPGVEGSALTIEMEIKNQQFILLNAGPQFKFNESVSFAIEANSQEEIDYYWEKLIANGGEPSQCGWLKDKFGLSWQVSPAILDEFITSDDRDKAKKAMDAMLKMSKIIIKDIEESVKK